MWNQWNRGASSPRMEPLPQPWDRTRHPEAINYDPEALIDDGSCQVNVVDESCQADLNGDGIVTAGDLLQFLAAFGLACN